MAEGCTGTVGAMRVLCHNLLFDAVEVCNRRLLEEVQEELAARECNEAIRQLLSEEVGICCQMLHRACLLHAGDHGRVHLILF